MHIEDRFVVPAPVTMVWQAITDPTLVASCVPGCETVGATVKVQVGPIKARFNLTVEVKEQIPLTEIKSVTHGEEGTNASIVTAENVVQLAPTHDSGTKVRYASEVTMGKFGFGVMQKAKALGEDFARAFRDKLAVLDNQPVRDRQ